MINVTIPMKIVNEGNCRDHWTVKARRVKRQKWAIKAYLGSCHASIPCHVHLTRLGPLKCDWDNMVYTLKAARDAVADFLIPNLRPGMADSDPRIVWSYAQEKGKSGLRIEIFEPSEKMPGNAVD